MKLKNGIKMTAVAMTNVTILALLVVMTLGSSLAFAIPASLIDPTLEMFRVRCQIDVDIDPATGLETPKVQIQAKARAENLEGVDVTITVINRTTPTLAVTPYDVAFAQGGATADWDTFPDPGDPNIVLTIPGDFAVPGDDILAEVVVSGTLQYAALSALCDGKTGSQFRQDTKGQCTQAKFLRNKCKEGNTYTTADGVEHTYVADPVTGELVWQPPIL